jgi:hypothetical protein
VKERKRADCSLLFLSLFFAFFLFPSVSFTHRILQE